MILVAKLIMLAMLGLKFQLQTNSLIVDTSWPTILWRMCIDSFDIGVPSLNSHKTFNNVVYVYV